MSRGVFVASGVVSGASQEATEFGLALLGDVRPVSDELRHQRVVVFRDFWVALTSSAETSAGCMIHFASILAARANSCSVGGSASRALLEEAQRSTTTSLWCPDHVS